MSLFAPRRIAAFVLVAIAWGVGLSAPAAASTRTDEVGAYLVMDAATGEVLARKNIDRLWYPASVTKLMTAYTVFRAYRDGRAKPTSPVTISKRAASQPPSKMGFKVGSVMTLDNALKMIMVKSANDVSLAIAESVGGGDASVFIQEMNAHARRLGMSRTIWQNPHGLPDTDQVTTARDLAILGRALLREFPEHRGLYRMSAIELNGRRIKNHNHLLERFPGSDGMKTGFICAAGFNVVASATRNGRQLITVVLGAINARERAETAAELFLRAFQRESGGFFGLSSSGPTLASLPLGPEARLPAPNMRQEVCVRRRVLSDEEQEQVFVTKRVVVASEDPADRFAAGANMTQVERRVVKVEKPSYLSAPFQTMAPVKVWLGGADATYPTAFAAATPAPAVQASAVPPPAPANPGAITALAATPSTTPPAAPPPELKSTAEAPLALPPPNQAGIAASLAPATGQPLVLAAPVVAPGAIYQAGSAAGAARAATPATAAAVPALRAMPGWPIPKARPARR